MHDFIPNLVYFPPSGEVFVFISSNILSTSFSFSFPMELSFCMTGTLDGVPQVSETLFFLFLCVPHTG